LSACVMYYGMPESDVARLKTLNSDVLGIFALQDNFINPGVVRIFQENMKVANKNLILKNYDAVHGFANPSNPKFDKVATEDAYKTTLEFFRARFK
jgi:carboxymethylenebutenolidase